MVQRRCRSRGQAAAWARCGGVPAGAGAPSPGVGVATATCVPSGAATTTPGGVAVVGHGKLDVTSLLTAIQWPSLLRLQGEAIVAQSALGQERLKRQFGGHRTLECEGSDRRA